mmetsp:Transcript_27011/g.46067  ORF Transcript_27011/g.46067 Transcript_27011/m.46067 type:complete len:302 (-) Transcript_27011:70-975(-)|eukprot:CAMPEP_0183703254 /NCGR_PEP_ID=MMETSP0737-20130205/1065_1 /TAXON_ID=385413 /ORGANISM="Thalassiosira miniscula, Strain CCMP1093" /LENGTH=301 /DNA_ID=CAMNT_0025929973 /DNA_START=61 /DNA_END=966 /DNA_ORIENTATION=-
MQNLRSSINSTDAAAWAQSCLAACSKRLSQSEDGTDQNDEFFNRLQALRLQKQDELERRLSEEFLDHEQRDFMFRGVSDGDISRSGSPAGSMMAGIDIDEEEKVGDLNMLPFKMNIDIDNNEVDSMKTMYVPISKTERKGKRRGGHQVHSMITHNVEAELLTPSRKFATATDDVHSVSSASTIRAHMNIDDIIELKLLLANQQATIDALELSNRQEKQQREYLEGLNDQLVKENAQLRAQLNQNQSSSGESNNTNNGNTSSFKWRRRSSSRFESVLVCSHASIVTMSTEGSTDMMNSDTWT